MYHHSGKSLTYIMYPLLLHKCIIEKNNIIIIYYRLYLELWINFVSASIKRQPLYKGQKVRSQYVRYSKVPL